MAAPNTKDTGQQQERTSQADQAASRIRAWLASDKVRAAVTAHLPEGVSYERVGRDLLRLVYTNPDLLKCTPASLLSELAKGVRWDLELGRTWHLVPRNVKVKGADGKTWYENRAFAQMDYKGKMEIVLRYKVARMIDAQPVFANEQYRCVQGTNPFVEHHPLIMYPEKRGALIGGYAVAKLGAYDFRIVEMSKADIDAIRRDFSKQWNERWEDGNKVKIKLEDILWYVQKTCINRLVDRLPLNPRAAKYLKASTEPDEIEEVEADAEPQSTAAPATPAPKMLGEGALQPIDLSKAQPEREHAMAHMPAEDPYHLMQTAQAGASPSAPMSAPMVQHPDDIADDHTPADDEEAKCPF